MVLPLQASHGPRVRQARVGAEDVRVPFMPQCQRHMRVRRVPLNAPQFNFTHGEAAEEPRPKMKSRGDIRLAAIGCYGLKCEVNASIVTSQTASQTLPPVVRLN